MTEPEPALVGVDFTADALRIVLASPLGEVLYRQDFALPELLDEDAWAWEVGGRISTCFAAEGQHRSAAGIAVACPGTVDPVAGRIQESTAREAWDGLPVVEALRRHIDAPIVALGRLEAALRGEYAAGAAEGVFDAVYVSLAEGPAAAILSSGRIVGGVHGRAGSLPAFPALLADTPLSGEACEEAAAILADIAAFLDPAVLVLHGPQEHVQPLVAALDDLLPEIAPATAAVPAALGDNAALLGALKAAAIVAYENHFLPDEGDAS